MSMFRSKTRPALAVLLTATTVLVAGCSSGESGETASAPEQLTGLLRFTPGAVNGDTVSGTWFRMVQPGGTPEHGPYMPNGDSPAQGGSTTLLKPGTAGGLRVGGYQSEPNPGFTQGNSLSASITEPTKFFAVEFGISTNPVDPQTQRAVPPPTVVNDHGKLTADLSSWAASWNDQEFNQGAPKPPEKQGAQVAGAEQVQRVWDWVSQRWFDRPAADAARGPAATGTYDAKTRAFTLQWTSAIAGGPFNGFTGVWHLEGVYEPADAAPAAAAQPNGAAPGGSGTTGGSTPAAPAPPGSGGSVPGASVPLNTGGSAPAASVPLNTGGSAPAASVPLNTGGSAPAASVPLNTGGSVPSASVPLNTGGSAPSAAVPVGTGGAPSASVPLSPGAASPAAGDSTPLTANPFAAQTVNTQPACPLGWPAPKQQGGLASLIGLAPLAGPFSSEAFALGSVYQPILQLAGPVLAEISPVIARYQPALDPFIAQVQGIEAIVLEAILPYYGPYRAQLIAAEGELARTLAPILNNAYNSEAASCLVAWQGQLIDQAKGGRITVASLAHPGTVVTLGPES